MVSAALFHDRAVVMNDPYASPLWSFCAFSKPRSSSQPRVLRSVPRRIWSAVLSDRGLIGLLLIRVVSRSQVPPIVLLGA